MIEFERTRGGKFYHWSLCDASMLWTEIPPIAHLKMTSDRKTFVRVIYNIVLQILDKLSMREIFTFFWLKVENWQIKKQSHIKIQTSVISLLLIKTKWLNSASQMTGLTNHNPLFRSIGSITILWNLYMRLPSGQRCWLICMKTLYHASLLVTGATMLMYL